MSAKPGTQIIENLTSYINSVTGGEDSNLYVAPSDQFDDD